MSGGLESVPLLDGEYQPVLDPKVVAQAGRMTRGGRYAR